MEGEAGAAILQVLVQNLIDTLKKEISLITDLDKDVEKLTESLRTIQKFLNDAEMRTVPDDESVKNWLKKLEDTAFDADHALDEVNYHLHSKEIKKKNKVLSCFSFSSHVSRPRKTALRIKEISQNLDSINNEATELGLVERLAHVYGVPDVGSETDSYTLDPIFIGRDGVLSKIVDKILTAANDERVVSTLCIVGMGGLGKTTLTRKVFNHQKIETQFGLSRIWVHVSQNFDPVVLLKKIVKKFMRCDEAENREGILEKLKEALKDKTYLLVLDDIWNEDPLKWESFMNGLKGVTSTKGNSIVVTTRNTKVASTVDPLYMDQLQGLSEEDCWSIIKEKTFGKGEDAVPSEMEFIGRKIARRCQGLPLAANVVGGVLQRDKSEENWLSIQQKWLPDKEGENITRILRLSFDSLSSPSLKKCFAYCSMFPKGYKMEKQEVIEQWMAEGFLQPDDGSDDMESLGEKFINILLNNSLLQVAWRDDYDNVERCSMHDLVHDLAHSVLGCSDRRTDSSSRVRYMILDDESSPISRTEARYFRTLVVDISGANFSHFQCLHVLTLDHYEVEELPSSIKKLIHLRKLNISGTNIKNLPKWIGELHYLQTLRADTGYLNKLPSTMKYLINIRHLYLDEDVVLPAGIGRLTSLQTLSRFGVGDQNGCSNIAELGSLNNLKGKLGISHLQRVLNKEEAKKANLFGKSRISELSLTWDAIREGEIKNDEEVLEGLQPPADLKKLVINEFKGKRFPAWTVKMAVQNVPPQDSWIGLNKLIEIRLSVCSECEEIPMMGHLPNLKSLWLFGLWNVKRIDSSVYGLAYKDTRVVFPALQMLVLDLMPELAEWAEVESSDVQVFPRLQSLRITWCDQLTSVPTHSSSCLEELVIESKGSSMDVANIFRVKYAMLTRLCLQGMDDLEYLPDWLFNENPNLKKLEIRECPKLRELPLGLRTLSSSLKELNIENCPCLERIPDEYDGGDGNSFFFFRSLRIMKIKRCDALVCLPCELVGSSLMILELESLSSLKNLPSLLDCMAARSSSRLRRLKVVGVPKFMVASGRVEDWGTFLSLRELDVEGSMETVDGILQGCCQSLHRLTIRGMEDCDSLPESIQRHTALVWLVLENYGMEELPEWFGNLSSSLWRLELCNCKKLRRLPSMDAMRRLQGLEWLTIEGCPELLAQGVADPQWPNISHIPYITIDGTPLNAAAGKCFSFFLQ